MSRATTKYDLSDLSLHDSFVAILFGGGLAPERAREPSSTPPLTMYPNGDYPPMPLQMGALLPEARRRRNNLLAALVLIMLPLVLFGLLQLAMLVIPALF